MNNIHITLNKFKLNGKWNHTIENLQIPHLDSYYEIRQYLDDYIKSNLEAGFHYVSLDEDELGFPYMITI